MRKIALFDGYPGPGWPDLKMLKPYFLGGKDRRWVFESGTDQASLCAEGVDGTKHLEENRGRIDITFFLIGHPNLGVLLMHNKKGGGHRDSYASKHDLTRLDQYYRDRYGSLLPIGLFIPFEDAWRAVKEFIETDGALPNSIDWIASRDLPSDAFPEQSPAAYRQYWSRIVLHHRPGPS